MRGNHERRLNALERANNPDLSAGQRAIEAARRLISEAIRDIECKEAVALVPQLINGDLEPAGVPLVDYSVVDGEANVSRGDAPMESPSSTRGAGFGRGDHTRSTERKQYTMVQNSEQRIMVEVITGGGDTPPVRAPEPRPARLSSSPELAIQDCINIMSKASDGIKWHGPRSAELVEVSDDGAQVIVARAGRRRRLNQNESGMNH